MRRIFEICGRIPGCPPAADEKLLLSVFYLAIVITFSDVCALRIPFLRSFS